jgi:hypothetical protein
VAAIERYGIIIGAMKAGTTTLFDHLSRHPGIAPSKLKEPKYFARDGLYERGPEWYASMWDWDPSTHRVAMEASTHYSFRHTHPETALRMAAHPGEFRLVYLVREPVARIESQYHHALAEGWKVADRPLAEPIDPDLLEPCRYAWQLDAFTAEFPRSSILVLAFEDLVADTEGTVAKVLAHWDLPADDLTVDTELVRNSSQAKIVSNRLSAARRVPGSAWVAERLGPSARNRIKKVVGRGTSPPRLGPEASASIRAELAEDHRRLADEWGVDVSRWDPDHEPSRESS